MFCFCKNIDKNKTYVLLDGFKRQISAVGLQWDEIEVIIIGQSIEEGILNLLNSSINLYLHILEQSKFISYMIDIGGYTAKQLAILLCKSTGWISNRKNFADDCPLYILEKIFAGHLPSSSYSVIFRKFIQKWQVSNEDLKILVLSLSGKNLSIKELSALSDAFFTMGDKIREKIKEGKITSVLNLILPTSKVPITRLESEFQNKLEVIILSLYALSETFILLKNQSYYTPLFLATLNILSESYQKNSSQLNKILLLISSEV